MTRFLKIFSAVLLAGVVALSCSKDSSSTGDDDHGIDYGSITDIQYSQHVQPLLNDDCVSCHGPNRADAGLRLDSWDELIKGSQFGEAVIPFDADHSVMIEMLTKLAGAVHPADQGESALDSAEIAFLARWIDEGAQNDADEIPYANSTGKVYVCSQDGAIVNIIDVDAKVVIRNVDMQDFGFAPDSKPHHVAAAPDGRNWFVTMISAGTIAKFNANNELVATDTTEVPALLAIHPTENVLYVSRFVSVVTTSLYVLDTQSFTPITSGGATDGRIEMPRPVPHGLTIDHNGDYIYTASLSDNELMVVSNASKDFETGIPVGNNSNPLQMTISPDNSTLYLSASGKEQMLIVDISDPTAPVLIDSVQVGVNPWHTMITPDGAYVYVANLGSNTVSVINTATKDVQTIGAGDGSDGLSQPHGLVVSPDGRYVFVSCRNTTGDYHPRYDFGDNALAGAVVVINTATNQIEKVLEIEEFGSGMTIWSN